VAQAKAETARHMLGLDGKHSWHMERNCGFRRCYNCAYWINKEWAVCPQCGWMNH
jgi:hypothetical protein